MQSRAGAARTVSGITLCGRPVETVGHQREPGPGGHPAHVAHLQDGILHVGGDDLQILVVQSG